MIIKNNKTQNLQSNQQSDWAKKQKVGNKGFFSKNKIKIKCDY